MLELDYADLVNDDVLGFTPSPVFQPFQQPQQQSGHATPNRGGRGRGAFTPSRGGGRGAARGGSAHSSGTASPAGSFRGARGGGRGGAAARGRGGGLGSHFSGVAARGGGGRGGRGGGGGGFHSSGASTPRSYGESGGINPLLVPVKFVRASGAGLGTVGGEDDHTLDKAGAEAPRPPSHAAQSALADEVQRLTVVEAPPPETAFEPEPASTATMALDELEDAPDAAEPVSYPGLGLRRPSPPTPAAAPPAETPEVAADDEPPLFEISVTRSEVSVELPASLTPPAALRSTALEDAAEDDDSSEDEQIVFPRRAVAHADPVLRRPSPPPSSAPPTDAVSASTDFTALPASNARDSAAKQAPKQPHQQQQLPKPQSKKAQKRASRKARKAGREHARSGNLHLSGGRRLDEDEDEEDEDAEEGARMFARFNGTGAGAMDDMLSASDSDDGTSTEEEGHRDGQPRRDDSDLDWGSASPPPVGLGARKPGARMRGRDKKYVQRAARADQREADKLERLVAAGAAREEVELQLALEASAREERRRRRRAVEEDYAANVGEDDLEALRAFASGMAGSLGGSHERGDDLDRRMAEEEDDSSEWGTSSEEGSESDEDTADAYDRRLALEEEDDSDEVDSDVELEMEYSLGDADGRVEHSLSIASSDGEDSSFDSSLSSSTDSDAELYAFESALLAGQKVQFSQMGERGHGGRKAEREKKKERRRERKGKAREVELPGGEDEDEDDDDDAMLFTGKDSWADRDEDYIAKVQAAVRFNADLLETAAGGRQNRRANRRERNKLFKAVSEGNFDDIDLGDDIDDLDEELVDALFAEEEENGFGSSKKQRKKDKSFGGAFSASLAAQWDLDRSKKASKKAQRAAQRAAEREAEFRDSSYTTRGKAGKKGFSAGAALEGGSSNDAAVVNSRIRKFVQYDLDSSSLSLPPMSKKSRIAVHLLAEVYGLKSRSLGAGKHRFPVLERTSRTTIVGVSERRVRAIVGTADGEEELDADDWGAWGRGGRARKGKMAGLWKALEGSTGKKGRGSGGGGGLAKNHEGSVVGQGADKLGEDNVGFALLKKMGWTEGGQIGLSGGLVEPVVARVKTGKSGLGSGFAVSRIEAYELARRPA
ncbi:uncharacterized protein JCM10292_000269 [Rhodotorula paludigena]|uniref:uncharacterized protein n=1 Tax=Rhodotorula paludigena TaxID=86838 RepID=UPI003171F344